jgi:hypothetical protein
MPRKRLKARAVCVVLCATALAALSFAGSASAKLTGAFTVFQQCPWTNVETVRCLYSVTEGGEFVLGNKKVPIVNAVTLQAGYTKPVSGFSKLIAASNGITLSKTAQPVPGGLLGIVPPESSPPLVKALSKFFFENALTGVNSTLEFAKPEKEVLFSELHLAEEEEVAFKMPVKFRLENPFLGKNCYVGSSTSPVMLELTTGITSPPGPNKPIQGSAGEIEFLEGGRVLKTKGIEIVGNSWSAPAASGCGGILSFLVNPIINSQIGLAAAAGKNTAILTGTSSIATAAAVKKNNEENP